MKNNTIKIDVTKFGHDELNAMILSYVRNGFCCWQEEIEGYLPSEDKKYLCISGAIIMEEVE